MKTIVSKPNAPPQATTQKGEAINKAPSYDLKLSSQAVPFQDLQAGNKPGVSELSPMERGMCGCQNPIQAPFQQTHVDLMREVVRKHRQSLMYSVPSIVREQAVDTLNLLIRFDHSVSEDESRVLMNAVKIITAKGLPA